MRLRRARDDGATRRDEHRGVLGLAERVPQHEPCRDVARVAARAIAECREYLSITAQRQRRIRVARAQDAGGIGGFGRDNESWRFRGGIVDAPEEFGPCLFVLREIERAQLQQGDRESAAHRL